MSNPNKGEVRLEVGEKAYVLKLDFNALCVAESLSGKSLAEIIAEMDRGHVSSLRVVFLAAVSHQYPDMTLAQAGDLIGAVGLGKVTEAVQQAMLAAFPQGGASENPK